MKAHDNSAMREKCIKEAVHRLESVWWPKRDAVFIERELRTMFNLGYAYGCDRAIQEKEKDATH